MQGRVQSFVAVHFYPYMRQRGVFVSQFISTMAFGDASNMMSSTSLYAFLVYNGKQTFMNIADFGRLVGVKERCDIW